MKNHFSRIFIIGIITVSIVSFLTRCNPGDKGSANAPNEDSLKLMAERGKYLAHYVCGCIDCHSQRDYNKFSGLIIPGSEGKGGEVFNEIYSIPGVVFARNITPDTVYGIGKWTDEDLVKAITRGIRKNGDTLYPIMPYSHYNKMSKEDIYSIIAYIRTLKPSDNKVPDRYLTVPVSVKYPLLTSLKPEDNIKPDRADTVNYGAYVVNSAACMDCHTPMENGKYNTDKLFAGGFTFNMGTFVVNTANITPDSLTGIGKWTEEMFMDKFKNFRDPVHFIKNPGKVNSIMPWSLFTQMDDADIKAIYRYLRTLKPITNNIEKYPKS